MSFPPVTLADWRAKVEKELAGKSFEKTLVQEAIAGIPLAPLYTEAPAGDGLGRETRSAPLRICMRHAPGATTGDLVADVEGGADALWIALADAHVDAFARPDLAGAFFVFDPNGATPDAVEHALAALPAAKGSPLRFALNDDPLGRRAVVPGAFATLPADLAALPRTASAIDGRFPGATSAMVSTLAYHDAGADAADELAFALSTGVRYLEALREGGLSRAQAARQVAFQIAIGRDTFLQLCKLRALRTCWQKVLTASGVPDAPRTLVHAVCSSRTLAARDPWVNMLRCTTQTFAAVLGGADLVTPTAFDEAIGAPSAHGRRVARNTGLVLREESYLGKVSDPAGGSYYLDTLTDALAREAWKRFQALERDGGIAAALESGALAKRLETAWRARLDKVAKRKTPVLGVSEFANLGETLPVPAAPTRAPAPTAGGLLAHRDSEAFEDLRARADAMTPPPEAVLVTLGTLAESRPRAGFAAGFFTAGGIRTRESTSDEKVPLACLCGSDERYAAEAAARARALKAAGCGRVLLAGRPGAHEASLREAGVDGFLFVGCDVVATLSGLLADLLEARS